MQSFHALLKYGQKLQGSFLYVHPV